MVRYLKIYPDIARYRQNPGTAKKSRAVRAPTAERRHPASTERDGRTVPIRAVLRGRTHRRRALRRPVRSGRLGRGAAVVRDRGDRHSPPPAEHVEPYSSMIVVSFVMDGHMRSVTDAAAENKRIAFF